MDVHSSNLALELAQLAARHIAEEGLNYAEAKRKAAKQVGITEHNSAMPSNQIIEQALREYQAVFMSDTQPAELQRLRALACEWLDNLTLLNLHDSSNLNNSSQPLLALAVGAVVNGTAGEHSPVHIQVFTDELKALEIALLNAGVGLEHTEKKINGQYYPVLVAQATGVPIVLTILPRDRYITPIMPTTATHYAQTANATQLRQIATKAFQKSAYYEQPSVIS